MHDKLIPTHRKEASHGRNDTHRTTVDLARRAPTRRPAMNSERSGAREAPDARLVELEAEERYARERYQLYKARAYGSRLTSPGRLRELERRSVLAKRRLDRARAEHEPIASTDDRYLD